MSVPIVAAGPSEFDCIWNLVLHRAREHPSAVLVSDEHGAQLTLSQLAERAERVAAGLYGRGVRAGDVVSWQLPSRIDTLVLVMALSRLGVVQNPLIPMLREPEVAFICGQTRSKLLIVPRTFRNFDHLAMAEAVALRLPLLQVLDADGGMPEADPADLPLLSLASPDDSDSAVRWLFYTSGTTAMPKGARHTDSGLLAAARVLRDSVGLRAGDRIADLVPMAHVGGILYALSAIMTEGQVIITEVFDPTTTPEQLSDAGVTLGGCGVPFLQAYLKRQRERPDRPFFPLARAHLIGGSPRPPHLHDAVKNELGGVGLISGYGLTECPYVCWGSPDDPSDRLATSEGRPTLPVEVKVVDADGNEVPSGTAGELRVRGPQLMIGYVDPGLDTDAFDGEGFFLTGDMAVLDSEGYLTITGRTKDVVIRNMENISAREVEELASTMPQIATIAIIGLPDEDTGERVVAVVVPDDARFPPSLDELCAYLRGRGLNPRKLPVQLEIVASLPMNAMGKVVKTKVKEQLR
ncbi:MAG: putative O-succinylbenzoate--CoA ligase [Subtercola sp.]|nr:putative O-succinylbenzoate--CoA ligase [Subtercola sp.]